MTMFVIERKKKSGDENKLRGNLHLTFQGTYILFFYLFISRGFFFFFWILEYKRLSQCNVSIQSYKMKEKKIKINKIN